MKLEIRINVEYVETKEEAVMQIETEEDVNTDSLLGYFERVANGAGYQADSIKRSIVKRAKEIEADNARLLA